MGWKVKVIKNKIIHNTRGTDGIQYTYFINREEGQKDSLGICMIRVYDIACLFHTYGRTDMVLYVREDRNSCWWHDIWYNMIHRYTVYRTYVYIHTSIAMPIMSIMST